MLTDTQINTIRDFQSDGIKNKSLTADQLGFIFKNNWFNLWVPKDLNGLEMEFPEGLALLEELAYWDAGFAWTVTLCAGANMFSGFLEPSFAQSLWQYKEICLGGSGKVTGRADQVQNGYQITGLWNYATGAPHLTHFTLNAPVYRNNKPLVNQDNEQIYYSFLIPRDQVLIHFDWDTFGLESTASHSFSVDGVFVSEEQAFQLDPTFKKSNAAIYDIPFIPFAEFTLLVNYMGMYHRFLDLVEKYYFEKSTQEAWMNQFGKERFKQLDKLQQEYKANSMVIYDLAKEIWCAIQKDRRVDLHHSYQKIENRSREMVKNYRMVMAELMPYLGIKAAQKNHELNIVFRNFFTATQHSLLNGS